MLFRSVRLTDGNDQRVYHAMQHYIKIDKLNPEDIYRETNEADEQNFKIREKRTAVRKEDIRRLRHKQLANLMIEGKTKKSITREELVNAKLNEILGVCAV